MAADVRNVTVRLDALTPHPRNYRRHPDAQLSRLESSLARFGQVRSIVVQQGAQGHYLIVAGHGIAQAAKRQGLKTLRADVIPADWTDEQVEGYLIADNLHSDGAEDDNALLAQLLEEQRNAGYDLASVGMTDEELEALLADLQKTTPREVDDPSGGGDDFDTEPQEGETRCQPGDLWQLGTHRLLCGDSTRREDVQRLMDGETLRCVWTDPPYGINHSGGTKDPRSRSYRSGDKLANDNLSDDATERQLADALTLAAAHAEPAAVAYIASPAGTPLPHFIAAMASSGFQFMHSLVWVKDTFVFARCDYHYRHESILFGWIQNGAHYQTSDRTQDSVFEVPRPKRSEEHPTMKPILLIAPMIEHSSQDGEIVYDAFCGSGSTLIACERLGRQCRAIEIDPRYCDVILRRWEAETGREATLLSRQRVEQEEGVAQHGAA